LYVSGVKIAGGVHNVVYIATTNNTVYAYDADLADTLYWKRHIGTPVPSTSYNTGGHTYMAVYPTIGILSTPVIDPALNNLYCVTDDNVNGSSRFYLHSLDLSTGQNKIGPPVEIDGYTAGVGNGSVAGKVTFHAIDELQRPALLESKSVIYIGFGSHNDQTPSFGWMFAYSAQNLSLLACYCSGPNGNGLGSFWNSGQGPAVGADGNIIASTGNGPFDANLGGYEYGQSVVKLRLSGGTLSTIDYFTPWDYKGEDARDEDLGSCGPLLIPGANLALQGGKDGHFYLLDTSSLGHYSSVNDDQIVQDFQACESEIHGSPVCRQSGSQTYVYVWSQGDYLKQFALVDGLFDTTPIHESSNVAPPGGPGGILSVSAAGNTPGSGIVWVNMPDQRGGYNQLLPGILRAYNADDVSTELWDSDMDSSRDAPGYYAKFVAPTIANDKVYLASDADHVNVYGLLP
jgi:hypothetical protein